MNMEEKPDQAPHPLEPLIDAQTLPGVPAEGTRERIRQMAATAEQEKRSRILERMNKEFSETLKNKRIFYHGEEWEFVELVPSGDDYKMKVRKITADPSAPIGTREAVIDDLTFREDFDVA